MSVKQTKKIQMTHERESFFSELRIKGMESGAFHKDDRGQEP